MKRQNVRKATLILSLLLFPITIYYFSPMLIIVGAASGIVVGSAIMFTLQFAASLFFGRAFCGYVCPAGGLQECLMMANGKNGPGGKLNWIKYGIWAIWLAVIVILFLLAGDIKEISPLYMTTNGISVADPYAYIVYYAVVLLITILALTSGKRAFCHTVCWMAPFMVLGTKLSSRLRIPSLKLKGDSERCISCKKCTRVCPMSLDVEAMIKSGNIHNTECILCGECIAACPKQVIKYTFGNNRRFV